MSIVDRFDHHQWNKYRIKKVPCQIIVPRKPRDDLLIKSPKTATFKTKKLKK